VAHFIYILFFMKGPFSRLLPLAIVWFAIGISFLPWLPNFFRQLGMSVQGLSVVKLAVTFYEMIGSPYSTPEALLITTGIILFGICSIALFPVRQFLIIITTACPFRCSRSHDRNFNISRVLKNKNHAVRQGARRSDKRSIFKHM
jgi:hypothetical protein